MAWTLQPVVTVGLQILLSIFLGWLLVRLRILDAEKYMPQVNTLVLWVGVTSLSGYYLGLKLQLDDAAAWRSLAAYSLWIAVIKVGILTYCLVVRRSHHRRANRSCNGNNADDNDRGNGHDVSKTNEGDGNGGGDGGSRGGNCGGGVDNERGDGGGYSVLREFALLTLVLTANNCGMIGLPIMDATFGPPGRRLALLTGTVYGIPVMLWVVPFAIFAFEMHKVRADAQEQQWQRRSSSSNMSCGLKLEDSDGGGGGTANASGLDGGPLLRKAYSVALPVGNVSRSGGSGTAAAALIKPGSVRHGASAAVLRRRNTGARDSGSAVRLTPFWRSGDGSVDHTSSGGGDGTTANANANANANAYAYAYAVDTRWDSDQNTVTFADSSKSSEAISVKDAAKLRRSLEVASGGGGNVTAAAGAVKAATAAASSPLPPLIPPRVSPFAAMAGDYGGAVLAAGGVSNEVFDGTTIRPVAATASHDQQTMPRRSSSLSAYRAAAAPQLLSTVPSGDLEDVLPVPVTSPPLPKPTSPETCTVLPAVPLPAALSSVSVCSGALDSSEQCPADGSTGQTGRVTESPTARHRIAPQPRKSFNSVTAALAGSAGRGMLSAPSSPVAPSRLETRPSSTGLSAVDLPIPHRWLLGEEEAGLPVAGRQSQGDAAGSDGDDTGGVTTEPAAPVVSETGNIVFRQLRAVIWTVGKNPILWSLLLALVTNLSGLRKFLDPDSQSFVQELEFIPGLLHWFASIAIPVSLVSIGVWMYGKRMRASLLKQAGTLLLLKVMVLPLLQAACAVAVGLPPEPTITLVLLALCPTATTSFVIAAHFGYGTDVVSAVTLGGTILLVPAILVALQLPRGMGIAVHLTATPAPAAAGGE